MNLMKVSTKPRLGMSRSHPRPEIFGPGQEPPPGSRGIYLTRGWVAWVDEADYEDMERTLWHTAVAGKGVGYAKRNAGGKTIFMHKALCSGHRIDHIKRQDEHMVVDNRRSNLRSYTGSQNNQNSHKRKSDKRYNLTSAFKGVGLNYGKWRACLNLNGKRIAVGRFSTEGLAAYAYDLAAVEHFGDYALTNFPVPGSTNWIYGPSSQETP